MEHSEKIERVKEQIRGYERRKEQLILDCEKAVAELDVMISDLKIELADAILDWEEVTTTPGEDSITLVSVKFDERGKSYDYIWDSREKVKVGDIVQVEGKWSGMRTVKVFDVKRIAVADAEHDYKCAYPLD